MLSLPKFFDCAYVLDGVPDGERERRDRMPHVGEPHVRAPGLDDDARLVIARPSLPEDAYDSSNTTTWRQYVPRTFQVNSEDRLGRQLIQLARLP